jgi:hypothetical protein
MPNSRLPDKGQGRDFVEKGKNDPALKRICVGEHDETSGSMEECWESKG